MGYRGDRIWKPAVGLSLLFLGACASPAGYSEVFESHGVRMTLEALPREGYIPMDAFIRVTLEVPLEMYHRYRGCFRLEVEYSRDDQTNVSQGCEEYDPDRLPDQDRFVSLSYSLEHMFYRADSYGVVVTVYPALEKDPPPLVKGKVLLIAKERRVYGNPYDR